MAVTVDHVARGGEKYLGHRLWRDSEGRLHRPDGPAVIYENKTEFWYWHGDLHRPDGPAVIYRYPDSKQRWFIHDQEITAKVQTWMRERNITWPFTPEQRMEFELRWLP